MNKVLIAPSILAGDFANMQDTVEKITLWKGDIVHCDVMDGVFVPNLTFGMPMVGAIKKHTNLPLDVHLMIIEPEKYVEQFAKSGADIITFHPNATQNPSLVLNLIKKCEVKAGLVFNPDIDIDEYFELIKECDIIVIMSVYAGYGGQKFIPETLAKVKKLKKFLQENNLNIPIEIDGGINPENAKLAKSAGVTILVAGSSVYNAKDPTAAILSMRND